RVGVPGPQAGRWRRGPGADRSSRVRLLRIAGMSAACDKSRVDHPGSPGRVRRNCWERLDSAEETRRMAANQQFAFGSFRFDARTGQLWRGRVELKLTPRTAAVLHALAERAQ